MVSEKKTPAFELGMILITRNAFYTLKPEDVSHWLFRHSQGQWGMCSSDDAHENDLALANGHRLLSVYCDSNGTKFWIITEADRSVTTVLLPEDY